VAVAVGGWLSIWYYFHFGREPALEPEPAAAAAGAGVEAAPRVEPDRSPAFETVTDKTPLGLRDMAAYDLLLQRARQAGAAELARQSRRDVLYTDLWERPERYRGVPVHLLGAARRIHGYDSKKSPRGRLYEAWITTGESQNNPYVCVFEDLPPGLPVGPDVSARVVFNGYFLKEMRYLSGNDIQRAAPVLIGKIGWTPGPTPPRQDRSILWMASIVALLFVIALVRWIAGFRRALSPRRRDVAPFPPAEDLPPDALAQWVESVRNEPPENPGGG
jgi:hypothetical protein